MCTVHYTSPCDQTLCSQISPGLKVSGEHGGRRKPLIFLRGSSETVLSKGCE